MKEKLLSKKVLIPAGVGLVILIVIIAMLSDEGGYTGFDGYTNGYVAVGGGFDEQPIVQPASLMSQDFANVMNILDDRVYAIEVNQALSRGFDTTTGELFMLNHFVGGRETAIFVMFNVPVHDLLDEGISPFLAIYRDDEFISELDWYGIVDDFTLIFHPRNMSEIGDWAVGEYVIEVHMDGHLAAYRITHFHQSTPYRVLIVPVVANYSGHIYEPSGRWMSGGAQILATFPLARADFEIILGAELDLTHFDIESGEDALFEVWRELQNLQTMSRDFDAIVGIVAHPIGPGILGYTFGGQAVVASESDPEMYATIVHEIAHLFGIGDEYEGGSANVRVNMMPYGMTASDKIHWANQPLEIGTSYPVMRGMDAGFFGEGSPIFPLQRPFYVAGRNLLYNPISYMSSGGIDDPWRLWVTSDQWIHKHRLFTGVDAHLIDAYTMAWVNSNLNTSAGGAMTGRAAQETREVTALEVRVDFSRDGNINVLPWYHFEIDSAFLDNATLGEYSIRFYDDGGAVLSEYFFDVSFELEVSTINGREVIASDYAAIDLLLEFPANTAEIAIYRGGDEIYSVILSQTAPTISFTGLVDDQSLVDSVTLTWDATGERELFFDIWYSPADDVYFNVASDITGNSFTVDLTQLPGTSEGFFYIYVTDGVRTSSAASPWVIVPYKVPIIITTQQEIPQFRITDEILIEVEIYDKQDGFLWDEHEVFWILDGEEFFVMDTLWVWPYELPAGLHTFTLRAVNSAGLYSEMDFSIRIIDDESALPSDWSRDYIVTALRNGFVADLSRLDMPINRGRFAQFMHLMFLMAQEDYENIWQPYYVEGMIIDSGAGDSYAMFLMVYLGFMNAENGRFNPSGTITELEAALIMFRVAQLADPDIFDSNNSDSDILEFLREMGIINTEGANALNEAVPLTNRLAMVRLGLSADVLY